MPSDLCRDELKRETAGRVDLVGFASVGALESQTPAESRPSTIGDGMQTFIVFGKKMLTGVAWARHLPSKQLAGGRSLRLLDLVADDMCRWLEERGHVSMPVPSAALDFELRKPTDLTPAGQGSTLLRHAAVAGGLGTWGLNLMVLTPQFGPRVYFGGVMTRSFVDPDQPLAGELCLGLEECGRCAAVCPEDAIPRRAAIGAEVADCRSLDSAACARSCQPFGFGNFESHLAHIFSSKRTDEMWERMRSRQTGEMWSEMAMMKEAALTGCSECIQVCPVGEDWERVRGSSLRRSDLPDPLPRRVENGMVEVEHLGPQIRRTMTWEQRK